MGIILGEWGQMGMSGGGWGWVGMGALFDNAHSNDILGLLKHPSFIEFRSCKGVPKDSELCSNS